MLNDYLGNIPLNLYLGVFIFYSYFYILLHLYSVEFMLGCIYIS